MSALSSSEECEAGEKKNNNNNSNNKQTKNTHSMEYLACYASTIFLFMDWFAIKAFEIQNFRTDFLFINYVKAVFKFTVTSESINIAKPALDVTVTFAVIN